MKKQKLLNNFKILLNTNQFLIFLFIIFAIFFIKDNIFAYDGFISKKNFKSSYENAPNFYIKKYNINKNIQTYPLQGCGLNINNISDNVITIRANPYTAQSDYYRIVIKDGIIDQDNNYHDFVIDFYYITEADPNHEAFIKIIKENDNIKIEFSNIYQCKLCIFSASKDSNYTIKNLNSNIKNIYWRYTNSVFGQHWNNSGGCYEYRKFYKNTVYQESITIDNSTYTMPTEGYNNPPNYNESSTEVKAEFATSENNRNQNTGTNSTYFKNLKNIIDTRDPIYVADYAANNSNSFVYGNEDEIRNGIKNTYTTYAVGGANCTSSSGLNRVSSIDLLLKPQDGKLDFLLKRSISHKNTGNFVQNAGHFWCIWLYSNLNCEKIILKKDTKNVSYDFQDQYSFSPTNKSTISNIIKLFKKDDFHFKDNNTCYSLGITINPLTELDTNLRYINGSLVKNITSLNDLNNVWCINSCCIDFKEQQNIKVFYENIEDLDDSYKTTYLLSDDSFIPILSNFNLSNSRYININKPKSTNNHKCIIGWEIKKSNKCKKINNKYILENPIIIEKCYPVSDKGYYIEKNIKTDYFYSFKPIFKTTSHIIYTSDEFGKITGKKEEEVFDTITGTEETPIDKTLYFTDCWICNKNVKLKNNTLIPKGNKILKQQFKDILVNAGEKYIFTVKHIKNIPSIEIQKDFFEITEDSKNYIYNIVQIINKKEPFFATDVKITITVNNGFSILQDTIETNHPILEKNNNYFIILIKKLDDIEFITYKAVKK